VKTSMINMVPITRAWHVLSLWMEERPPIWKVTADIFNKESRKADKLRSYSMVVGKVPSSP